MGEIQEIEVNHIYNIDCMSGLKLIPDKSIDMVLTDIPYNEVNIDINRLRNLNKEEADILTFDLEEFLDEVYRVSKGSICIFCGMGQFSTIYNYFTSKRGTVRPIIWEKTNPSPMNGQHIYLSGVEVAVWFKRSGAKIFNAYCKNTVFRFPNGKRDIHPTQKNIKLFKELILDNTDEGDIVLDTCLGGGTTVVAAIETNRKYIGFELEEKYFEKTKTKIENLINTNNERP